ncbi:CRISPR-associated ring nuclease Csm6 [Vibrio breoganii]
MKDVNILVTVLGSSPAVITETFYALHKRNQTPDKLIIFTTSHGKHKFHQLNVTQKLQQLCSEQEITTFDPSNIDIFVAKNNEGELEDIRCENDQVVMADFLTSHIRTITSPKNTRVHASIAGGRKSMSFYMGYIFSMFAREQDTLSHVLVPPDYEATDFFFPTQESQTVHYFDAKLQKMMPKIIDGEPLDAKNAVIELAEIPFIRLNTSLTKSKESITLDKNTSYSDSIRAYQLAQAPHNIRITVDTKGHNILVNDKVVELSAEYYAYYRAVLTRIAHGEPLLLKSDAQKLSKEVLLNIAEYKQMYQHLPVEQIYLPKYAEDILFEIGDKKSLDTFLANYERTIKTGEGYYFDENLHSKAKSAVKKALSRIQVGQTVELCEINIVSKEVLDDSCPQARSSTKSGYIGVMLNPRQITII